MGLGETMAYYISCACDLLLSGISSACVRRMIVWASRVPVAFLTVTLCRDAVWPPIRALGSREGPMMVDGFFLSFLEMPPCARREMLKTPRSGAIDCADGLSLPISKINGIFVRILPLQSGSHRVAIKRSRGLS